MSSYFLLFTITEEKLLLQLLFYVLLFQVSLLLSKLKQTVPQCAFRDMKNYNLECILENILKLETENDEYEMIHFTNNYLVIRYCLK